MIRRCTICIRVILLLLLDPYLYASQPSSTTGPSGSVFETALTWEGYRLATFVDLNADRQMDVVLLDKNAKQLFAAITPSIKSSLSFKPVPKEKQLISPPVPLFSPGLSNPIVSVAAADFNGDSLVDLMLLVASTNSGPYDVHIAYGVPGGKNISFSMKSTTPLVTLRSQPLICDLDSDAVADLFGEISTNERVIIYGGKNQTVVKIPYNGPNWSALGYSAFGDINRDTIPDVILLVTDNGQHKLQLYERTSRSGLPSSPKLIDLPLSFRGATHLTLGLFVLGDFDTDGNIDLLLPGCTTTDCNGGSSLFLYKFDTSQWQPVDVIWEPSKVTPSYSWSLSKTPSTTLLSSALVGPAMGDFDLDGKPDLGFALTYSSGSKTGSLPAVLLNQGFRSNTGRLTFASYLLPGASAPASGTSFTQIGFFDHLEKGVLDVFAVSNDASQSPSIQLYLQQMVNDHYFLKVTVLNGLCADPESCTDSRLPYGLPVPGQSSSYSTEGGSGDRLGFSGLMGVQSCCTSLQLPSMLYGLGPFANYVERLTVAIPPDSNSLRQLSIAALVPNSEVFVNPFPHSNPEEWTARLFLQPLYNMKVLYIAITLLCVCVLLIIIISILQCLELREDRKEKQREAQRFHFDAM